MVIYNCVDDEDFLSKSTHAIGKRVIYYFYLESSPACLRIKPLFDELCKKYEKTAIVYTYPYYNDDQLAGEAFEVQEVPTFIVMNNGQEIKRHVGAEEDAVKELFENYGN